MAPKAKPKAKAKAVAKAKALVKAKAKARHPPLGVRRGVVRRPAIADGGAPGGSVEEKWAAGEVVTAVNVPVVELSEGTPIVIPKAHYFLASCQVAGRITGLEVKGGAMHALMRLTGTTSESLLKLHTANPDAIFKVHLCGSACNQQEVADFLIHAQKIRKLVDASKEEGWISNLEKVRPLEGDDELQALRARGEGLVPNVGSGGGTPVEDVDKKKKDRKESKKDKKAKKKEERRKKEKTSTSGESVKLDGTMSKKAAKKRPSDLFSGTGLDPRDRIRRRVAKRARRCVKKRSKKDSSSSNSGSTGSSEVSPPDFEDETVFEQASKVRVVASGYPGMLASQTLAQMRVALLSELGNQDKPGTLAPCALAYFRQHVAKKASGPALREMLSIATSMDQLLSGNPAMAMDTLSQRFKSVESILGGCHWTVAQRLEIVPPDNVQLTPAQEMNLARRDVFEESRMRWLSSQPDGRTPSTSTKGQGGPRQKGEGKENPKGGGKDRRWGKGSTGKQDPAKKKEETTAKP